MLRPAVMAHLSDPTLRVVAVTAPAGYGKSSHVATAVRADRRQTAWIDIEPRHDDASTLLQEVVAALHVVGGLDPTKVPTSPGGPDPKVTGVAAALGRAVRRCTEPFVLVLDDVHLLTSTAALDTVEAVASNVPSGSLLVVIGRSCAWEAIARLRVEASVVEVDADDLSLDAGGVEELLCALGVEATEEQVDLLLAATEGWPVGVRLAAKGVPVDASGTGGPFIDLRGREPMVSDYLSSEWIGDVDYADRQFLLQVSVLDQFSAPLCDEVLGRCSSGEVLHRIEHDQHLLIPLDRRGDAYRMHGLLRDVLQAEFERIDRTGALAMHRRASDWFEGHGDPDRAVRHAVAAEEFERAEQLVVAHTPERYACGHYATIQRWVESLPRERVLRSPGLCVSATLAAMGLGDMGAVQVWLRLGEAAVATAPDLDRMAELCLLDLRATTNTAAARPARDDAERAHRGLPPGIWHAGACLAFGAWSWVLGEDAAVAVIQEGIDEAAVLGAPVLEAYCSAVRSMMAHAEGDTAMSRSLALRARRLAVEHDLDLTPGMAIVSAQHSLIAAAAGDADDALADWHLARTQLAVLREMSGWANVLARLALANASLLLGDRLGAETLLREARDLQVRQPDAVRTGAQLENLEQLVGLLRRRDASGASSLTTAELRVLHYLPTNLSLAEIAGRVYVSRYTVKTHCESIYRKLGVRSRSEAVDTARSLGLIERLTLPVEA
jgi:LuxR family maltose regulon positive regulatory protein